VTDVISEVVLGSFYELKEFDCLNKLVAQTYGGSTVMSGELNGVQAEVNEHATDAIFIHCCAHRVNLVLS